MLLCLLNSTSMPKSISITLHVVEVYRRYRVLLITACLLCILCMPQAMFSGMEAVTRGTEAIEREMETVRAHLLVCNLVCNSVSLRYVVISVYTVL